jgi:hypothetical protein
MHTRYLIFASILAALLFFTYFIFSNLDSDTEESSDTEETIQELISYNNPDQITEICFTSLDGDSVCLLKKESWVLKDYESIPLADDEIQVFLSGLEYLLAIRTVSESSNNLQQYGLSSPTFTFSLTVNGQEEIYDFGDVSSYYNGYYFRAEDSDIVYIVESTYRNLFEIQTEDLFEQEELPDFSLITEVRITSYSGKEHILSNDSEDDQEKQVMAAFSSLSIEKVIDYRREVYALFGLESPTKAEIIYTDEEGSSQTYSLSLGIGESSELLYGMISESQIIYLLSCEDLSILLPFME